MKARITDIQYCSLFDGPGIRTMIFFAGCGMRCKWCQNPEAFSDKAKVMFNERLCIGCGECLRACPHNAIAPDAAGNMVYNRGLCQNCLSCVKNCFAQARRASAFEISLEDLLKEAVSDEVFFRNSGGGVTLSGGEPLLQAEFNREFLKELNKRGIPAAIETAGYYPRENLEMVLPYTGLVLFDIKMIDPKKHEAWTAVENGRILSNFEYVAKNSKVILRVPLIPNINDGDEFEKIIEYVLKTGNVNELHILPFHNIGDEKYAQLGIVYPLHGFSTQNGSGIERCARIAQNAGLRVSVGGRGF